MITRFAPSPTGPLHIGHAYSAILAHDMAKAAGGQFLLRMEDTDLERSRPEWDQLIQDDLAWLGLAWPSPILRQSEHLDRYDAALKQLEAMDLLYPCRCTRADIKAAASAPQEGSVHGPVYPGTCRGRLMADKGPGDAIRLDMAKAVDHVDALTFFESGEAHRGTHTIDPNDLVTKVGDIVLGRKESGIVAYFMASALDDDHQNITDVVRGEDLFDFTGVQVLLLTLLGLQVPQYHHHRLIRDDDGKRLAKRDDARAIRQYREDGATPLDIRRMVGID